MTCIVGLIDGDIVYIGGDSAGVSGSDITSRRDTKVFQIRNESDTFLIGFTSSFRMGQLLRFKLKLPIIDKDIHEYMCTDFIDLLRACLKDGGYTKTKDGCESGGNFLVGIKRRLFEIHSDFQVAESRLPFMATGCGEPYAKGSLITSGGNVNIDPHTRVVKALEASEKFSTGVCAPFNILSI